MWDDSRDPQLRTSNWSYSWSNATPQTKRRPTDGEVSRGPPFLLTQILSVNPQESRATQYVRVLSLVRCSHGHVGALALHLVFDVFHPHISCSFVPLQHQLFGQLA